MTTPGIVLERIAEIGTAIRRIEADNEGIDKEIVNVETVIAGLLADKKANLDQIAVLAAKQDAMRFVIEAIDALVAEPIMRFPSGATVIGRLPVGHGTGDTPPLMERVATVIRSSAVPMKASDIGPLVGAPVSSVAPILGRLSQHHRIRPAKPGEGWVAVEPVVQANERPANDSPHPLGMTMQDD
jgi:hypothetical protein